VREYASSAGLPELEALSAAAIALASAAIATTPPAQPNVRAKSRCSKAQNMVTSREVRHHRRPKAKRVCDHTRRNNNSGYVGTHRHQRNLANSSGCVRLHERSPVKGIGLKIEPIVRLSDFRGFWTPAERNKEKKEVYPMYKSMHCAAREMHSRASPSSRPVGRVRGAPQAGSLRLTVLVATAPPGPHVKFCGSVCIEGLIKDRRQAECPCERHSHS